MSEQDVLLFDECLRDGIPLLLYFFDVELLELFFYTCNLLGLLVTRVVVLDFIVLDLLFKELDLLLHRYVLVER